MPHRPTGVVLILVTLLTSSACGRSADAPAAAPARATATPSPGPTATSVSPSPSAPAAATMTISSFEFVVPRSVRSGEQVTVVNQDREAHTVTIDRGAVRLTVLPGQTAVFTAPSAAGAHPLTCDLHAGMDAVLLVA